MLRRSRAPQAIALATFLPIAALASPAAAAEDEPPRAADQAAQDARTEAKSHFDKGNLLYEQRKDPGAALAEFLESRRLYPTWSATYNAALCLQELRRYDEALELLEAVLRDFGAALPAGAREEVQRQLIAARALVGTIEIEGAEPGATIALDGQNRGEYPLLAPLRAAAGSHFVQLYKEGYEPFGARVDVAGGRTAHVEARLRALERVGWVRVAEQGGAGIEVLVDGSRVGVTPWEGRLSPGDHVVVLRGAGHLGTPPVPVAVEVDRTARLTLKAEELSAEIRVEPEPVNATVAIDRVTVGRGVWAGRLRDGSHRVEVAAPGFAPSARLVTLRREERQVVRIALERDPGSPFAEMPGRRPRFVVDASGAATLLPGFGGSVAGDCSAPCKEGIGAGALGVLRAGYELGLGLGFGLSAGYLAMQQKVTDRATTLKPVGLPKDPARADDTLELTGVLAGAWGGLRLPTRAPVHFRLGAGAVIGALTDTRRGALTTRAGSAAPFGPLVEEHPARLVWTGFGMHVGWQIHPRFELYPSFEVLVLLSPSRPRWDAKHGFHASTDGLGTFASDALIGPAFVVLAPGLGARFDI